MAVIFLKLLQSESRILCQSGDLDYQFHDPEKHIIYLEWLKTQIQYIVSNIHMGLLECEILCLSSSSLKSSLSFHSSFLILGISARTRTLHRACQY